MTSDKKAALLETIAFLRENGAHECIGPCALCADIERLQKEADSE